MILLLITLRSSSRKFISSTLRNRSRKRRITLETRPSTVKRQIVLLGAFTMMMCTISYAPCAGPIIVSPVRLFIPGRIANNIRSCNFRKIQTMNLKGQLRCSKRWSIEARHLRVLRVPLFLSKNGVAIGWCVPCAKQRYAGLPEDRVGVQG